MNNFFNTGGIPLGFGYALSQNADAMAVFASLTDEEKQAVLNGTHEIRSKREMQAYVENLLKRR